MYKILGRVLFKTRRILDKNRVLGCSYLSRVLEKVQKRLKTHASNLKPNQNGANRRQTKQQQQQQQREQGLKTKLRKLRYKQ